MEYRDDNDQEFKHLYAVALERSKNGEAFKCPRCDVEIPMYDRECAQCDFKLPNTLDKGYGEFSFILYLLIVIPLYVVSFLVFSFSPSVKTLQNIIIYPTIVATFFLLYGYKLSYVGAKIKIHGRATEIWYDKKKRVGIFSWLFYSKALWLPTIWIIWAWIRINTLK